MIKKVGIFLMIIACCSVIPLAPSWSQVKNLLTNKEVTAKIKALDTVFFKGFDVYSAGTTENPSALLFDIKNDKYAIADRLWGSPLTEQQIVYAVHRLDDQFINREYDIPLAPQAFNIVNLKGEVVGYIYTGVTKVVMDRKKDGRVTVYLVVPKQRFEKNGHEGRF
jgi:Na+-translocating ferredoxin:NAD+ oxidoreductase RnfG subunit